MNAEVKINIMLKKNEVYVSNIDELLLTITQYISKSSIHNTNYETPNIVLDSEYGLKIISEGCKANDFKHNFAYFYALAQDGLIDQLDYTNLLCFLESENLNDEQIDQLYYLSIVVTNKDVITGQIILRFCARHNNFAAQLKTINLHLYSGLDNFEDAIMCANELAKKGYINPLYDLGKKYENDEFLSKYIMTKAKYFGSELAEIWLKTHGEK